MEMMERRMGDGFFRNRGSRFNIGTHYRKGLDGLSNDNNETNQLSSQGEYLAASEQKLPEFIKNNSQLIIKRQSSRN